MISNDLMHVEMKGDILTVTCKSENLVFSNSRMFFDSLAENVALGCVMILDIQAVRRLDSTGCGAILRFNRLISQAGGQLHVVCSQNIFDMLKRVSMDRIISICTSFDQLRIFD